MRQDISRSGQQLNYPSDPSCYGYAEHSFADIGRACDIWLKKRFPDAPPKRFGEIRRLIPKIHIAQETEFASSDRGTMYVPREKKPKWKRPSQKRYATDEERREALRAIVRAHWASLTPEERMARSAKSNTGRPKNNTPRWLDPKYKAYKNEWQRKRRETHPLTEEQLRIRREKAKAKYHSNREENRRKINERRLRAKAAQKTSQEA